MTGPAFSIEAIAKAHDVTVFESTSSDLNDFLKRFARQNEKKGGSRTYVAVEGAKVVGYYSLAASSVLHELAADGLKAGLERNPIPTLLLARLAVDKRCSGIGIGARLLRDALSRALSVSRKVGVRAVIVHAKDESAKAFYERFGFLPLPDNQLHLYLSTKDIEANLEGVSRS